MDDHEYSPVAEEQLDELAETLPAGEYNRTLDACDLVLNFPGAAQARSTAIVTGDGKTALLCPVVGSRYVVFWTSGPPPRVEAVFEYS